MDVCKEKLNWVF